MRPRRRQDGTNPWPLPRGHWKSTTFVAGLTRRGVNAPFVIGGPINGAVFETYVESVRVPDLRPDDVVIMGNLFNHKRSRFRDLIDGADAELRFLPPYSPHFNPIENAIAKLKALLRKAADRTVDGLGAAAASTKPSPLPNAQTASVPGGYDPDW